MTTQQQRPAQQAGVPGQDSARGAAPAGTHEATRRAGTTGGPVKGAPGAGKPGLFGVMGLCLGLGLGLAFGQIAAAPGSASGGPGEAPAGAADSTPIQSAVETCGLGDATGVEVMDGGRSVSLATSGEESLGASYLEVLCVLKDLGIPESVVSRMENTSALDGNQGAQWGDFSATWGYHPDSGLDVVVETATGN